MCGRSFYRASTLPRTSLSSLLEAVSLSDMIRRETFNFDDAVPIKVTVGPEAAEGTSRPGLLV